MPDSFTSLPEARCSALEDFFRSTVPESCTTRCQRRTTAPIRINPGGDHSKLADVKDRSDDARRSSPTSDGNGRNRHRGRGATRTNPRQSSPADDELPQIPPTQTQPSGRRPGTSKYYGVRFRPDLNKWVAEIRVAEWKAVDKKVWLGTFETEEAAARGVDLARKLLHCKKKHPPNLPCEELTGYSKQIPPHLNLTDLAAASMFKAATLFIKHECKEYAASFDDATPTDQIIIPAPIQQLQGSGSQNTSTDMATDSDESDDFSDMILEYGYAGDYDMMTINDHGPCGLPEDFFPGGFNHVTAMTTDFNKVGILSSPSSCTSAALSVTSEALQWGMGMQQLPEAILGEGMLSMMESALAEPEMELEMEPVGAVSQLWAADVWATDIDASLFHSWPALQDSACPWGLFPQLPESLSGLTPYMGSMDSDPWSLQGVHHQYPFHPNWSR